MNHYHFSNHFESKLLNNTFHSVLFMQTSVSIFALRVRQTLQHWADAYQWTLLVQSLEDDTGNGQYLVVLCVPLGALTQRSCSMRSIHVKCKIYTASVNYEKLKCTRLNICNIIKLTGCRCT